MTIILTLSSGQRILMTKRMSESVGYGHLSGLAVNGYAIDRFQGSFLAGLGNRELDMQ